MGCMNITKESLQMNLFEETLPMQDTANHEHQFHNWHHQLSSPIREFWTLQVAQYHPQVLQ